MNKNSEAPHKVVLLLSGGYDSPVAGYLLQQSGFEIISLHFSQEPFVDKSHEEKANIIAKQLGFQNFIALNIGHELLEISQKAKHSYYFVLMKRLMYKLATNVAQQYGASFIATGESLAQVSSQTLNNLVSLEDSLTSIPILRPLISYSKNEIMDIAKEIGTYEISTQPESCDKLGPDKPVINANLEYTINEELKLPMAEIILNIFEKNKLNAP